MEKELKSKDKVMSEISEQKEQEQKEKQNVIRVARVRENELKHIKQEAILKLQIGEVSPEEWRSVFISFFTFS